MKTVETLTGFLEPRPSGAVIPEVFTYSFFNGAVLSSMFADNLSY
jgi:hypothetical protein